MPEVNFQKDRFNRKVKRNCIHPANLFSFARDEHSNGVAADKVSTQRLNENRLEK